MLIAKADAHNSIQIFKRASLKSEPVIFSTDTIYGIGAPLSDMTANMKIFDIKGRDRTKPFPVLISNMEQLEQLTELTDKQRQAAEKVWPAPVTFILRAKKGIDTLFTINGTIAIRMPDKQWLRELINHTGAVSATSANHSGVEYSNDFKQIAGTFQKSCKYFVYERNTSSASSAIIDLSNDNLNILRPSEILPDLSGIF